jgi:hypothetical protein
MSKEMTWLMVGTLAAAGAAMGFGQDVQAQTESVQVGPTQVAAGPAAPMPRVVRYSGIADATPGQTLTLKFSLYENQAGGNAVWSESQQVTPGDGGKYSVLLGAATENGLPQNVFSAAQAKWLGVTIGDGQEQPRTILVATPYSLKASDAETLGGHPASDFVLSAGKSAAQPPSGTDITQINVGSGVTGGGTGPTVTLGLSSTYLETLGNQIYPQLTGTNKVTGKNTYTAGNLLLGTSPVLSVANVLAASPVTVTPSGSTVKIGLSDSALLTLGDSVYAQLAAANTFTKPMTFASGQTFPGTVSLSANNAFTGTDSFSKPVTFASSQTFPGTATLGGNNAFTGTDTITAASTATSSGALTVTDTASGNAIFAQSSNTGVLAYSTSSSSGAGIDAQGGEYGVYAQGSGSYAESTGVYGAGNGFGVYGYTEATGATGVYGQGYTGVMGLGASSATSATAFGSGVAGNGAIGIWGSTNYTGSTFSPEAILGFIPSNQPTATFAPIAIVGNTESPTGAGGYFLGPTGLYVDSNASTNDGVAISATGGSNYTSATVIGTGVAASGFYGVLSTGTYGVFSTGNAFGVVGEGPFGVVGVASTAGNGNYGFGVEGAATYESVEGQTFAATSSAGVWGDLADGVGDGSGVLATGDSSTGLIAANNSNYATIKAYNFTTNSGKIVFETYAPNQNSSHCTIDTSANLSCSGSLAEVQKTDGGESKAIYAVASAENWMEDAGSAQLSGGAAKVSLESQFGQTVNAAVDYHVFLTPNGDCKGLYVASKSATGFEVRELGGGQSNISFDYRIMAKRKGFESTRLEDLTERENARNQREAELAARRSAVKPTAERRPAGGRMPGVATPRPNVKLPHMSVPRAPKTMNAPVTRAGVELPQK